MKYKYIIVFAEYTGCPVHDGSSNFPQLYWFNEIEELLNYIQMTININDFKSIYDVITGTELQNSYVSVGYKNHNIDLNTVHVTWMNKVYKLVVNNDNIKEWKKNNNEEKY